MLFWRVTFVRFDIFQVGKNENATDFSVLDQLFPVNVTKKTEEKKTLEGFVWFSLNKWAGSAKNLRFNWQQK